MANARFASFAARIPISGGALNGTSSALLSTDALGTRNVLGGS